MQIIIVAGGGGARLWPVSNPNTPKQFVPIVGEKSSLEHVYNYLSEVFDSNQIWINTNQKYASKVLEILPSFNKKNLLLEPEKRDNFAAVSSQAALLSHYFGDKEPLIFVTSDEFVLQSESISKFQTAIAKIKEALESEAFEVVTIGVKAISPNTNYGYLELGLDDKDKCYSEVVKVKRFTEKPDLTTAQNFLEGGNYIWNKFNPSFSFHVLKKYLAEHDPKSLEILLKIEKTGIIPPQDYACLPKASFDYAFMEKVSGMGVIALDIQDWVDIGNWEIAHKFLPNLDTNSNQIQLEGSNNKAKLSNLNRKVAFVGVSNLLLVENEEGILIMNPKHSPCVKDVTLHFENKD